jgi:hypothetical protein
MPARVRVRAENGLDRVTVNGVETGPGAMLTASRELEIALVPGWSAPVDGAAASVAVAKDKHLVHVRIEAAPRLSQVPANASVVVLLDTSRSMERRLPSSLAAVRAYLSRFPGASVELLTFDRTASSPFGGPLPVREALSRLYAFAPVTRNGSHLDVALASADARLAARPGPRRILVVTDLMTRDALTPERLAVQSMTSGALVHLATVDEGAASLERDDESDWAKLPRKTGGLLWKASCDAVLGAVDRAVFEEWVRPRRVDRLKVTGAPSDFAVEECLQEGRGLEHLSVADAPVTQVTLEGELWSSPVRWSVKASVEEGRRWAGLVFGTPLYSAFDDKGQMTLALLGRVVSPVTSYLAIEPGVRPSIDGLERAGFGEGAGRCGGALIRGGSVCVGAPGAGGPDRRQAFLDGELARALAACRATSSVTVRATLESTLDEIVEVEDVTLAPARDAKIEGCVREALWAVTLPGEFVDDHASWKLSAAR